jgi:hypothetical protein
LWIFATVADAGLMISRWACLECDARDVEFAPAPTPYISASMSKDRIRLVRIEAIERRMRESGVIMPVIGFDGAVR